MDEVLIEITEIAPVVVPDDVIINITEVPNEVVITASSSEPDIIPASTALSDFLTGTATGAWVVKTLAQVKTILGLGTAAYTDLDANNRFVTDTEKGTWNAKQPAGGYLIAADITGKVDKVSGSSLLADTELAILKNEILGIACSDVTTDLTIGQKIAFDMPFSCVITRVYGSLTTPATGNALTVDIEDEGTSILNAVLSIADGANNGETSVFAAAAVNYTLTKGDLISIDIDQVGSTATGKGLIIFLEGYRT